MSGGTWPPFSAQLSRNHVSHARTLIRDRVNVANRGKRASPPACRSITPPPRNHSSSYGSAAGPRTRRSEALLSSGIRGSSGQLRSSHPVPVFLKAGQYLAAGCRPLRIGQLGIGLGLHGRDSPPQFDVGRGEFDAAHFGVATTTIVAIQPANPAQPGQRPLLVLGPALADLDEIATNVPSRRPAPRFPATTWAMAL